MTFGARLRALTTSGPIVCVGADPHPEILRAWGESDNPRGLASWSRRFVEVLSGAEVVVVKPQVAFFERQGVAGMTVLSELLGALRGGGLLVIGDAKRGDIGSTMEGYADAWLRPGSDFEVDALTLVAYQGVRSLAPALERARDNSKGVFVLAATSNEEAWGTQSAVRADRRTVAAGVIAELTEWGRDNGGELESCLGVVIGATVNQATMGVDLSEHPAMPILAPGYGSQGASFADVGGHFPHSHHVLAVSARALLEGGPDDFVPRYSRSRAEISTT